MEIVNLKLSDIHPYENNPRFNDDAVDAVADSIREFGFQKPIQVNKEHVILCGHTRYKAALKLNLETIPCEIVSNLSTDQEMAYRIEDNRTSEFATWDYNLLAGEAKDIESQGFEKEKLGFASEVLAELLYHDEEDRIDTGYTHPDDLPDYDGPVVSENGKIYQLGEHRLLCCDIRDNSLMSSLLHDGNAKAYFARFTGWDDDYAGVLRNGSSGLCSGGVFYVMFPDNDVRNFRLSGEGCELETHEQLLWTKSNYAMGMSHYATASESVLYGWKPGATHKWYSDRKQSNVLAFNNAPSGYPPVEMSVYLVRNSTMRGDVVLDNNTIIGNTVIACEQTGRRCRQVVYSPETCDLVRMRWAQFCFGRDVDWEKETPETK